MRAAYCKYDLVFKELAVTSRDTLSHKHTYFIKLWDEATPEVYGIGECALFEGLSAEDSLGYEAELAKLCACINWGERPYMSDASSIRFGIETALLDLNNGGRRLIFPGQWTAGKQEILINGLVWMGSIAQMRQRVEQKLEQGFRCIKFKIGGQRFDDELQLLQHLRSLFSADQLEIRLDANGAFTVADAMDKLERLAPLSVHSIEQPIKPHQPEEMYRLCRTSPIPIALDEELIGTSSAYQMEQLLDSIQPQYIILKPSLCGGLTDAAAWIYKAEERKIGWWVTSALESNIGLNALAQWVSSLNVSMPQGLGTGALYVNNITSPISQEGCGLYYRPEREWIIPDLPWITPGL